MAPLSSWGSWVTEGWKQIPQGHMKQADMELSLSCFGVYVLSIPFHSSSCNPQGRNSWGWGCVLVIIMLKNVPWSTLFREGCFQKVRSYLLQDVSEPLLRWCALGSSKRRAELVWTSSPWDSLSGRSLWEKHSLGLTLGRAVLHPQGFPGNNSDASSSLSTITATPRERSSRSC